LGEKSSAVLIVGGGVAGVKAALDAAEAGRTVYLIERRPHLGGTLLQLEKWFPTDDCGLCKVLPTITGRTTTEHCLRREMIHPRVQLLTGSTIKALEGERGAFTAVIERTPRGVIESRCTGCGLCVPACPVDVPDAFQEGLSTRKAIYVACPQSFPNVYAIDWEACTKCGECVKVCPTSAIELESQGEELRLDVGAVILTPGFEEYDPSPMSEYGYGTYPGVVTCTQFERMRSPAGPSEGMLTRPVDAAPVRSVAFLQCVGSRDASHPYCSAACCMHAIKEAQLAKDLDDSIETDIYFMDIRAPGKGYYRYQTDAEAAGVNFIRCRVSGLRSDPATGALHVSYETEDGELKSKDYDLAVLSVGQTPPPGAAELADAVGIELTDEGFCKLTDVARIKTTRPGVYVCGSFGEPSDIPETVVAASACAAEALADTAPSEPVEAGRGGPPEPGGASLSSSYAGAESQGADTEGRPVEGQPPRVAVVLCRCGGEISNSLPVDEFAEDMAGVPGVAWAGVIDYPCLPEGLDQLCAAIADTGITWLVVGGCVPYRYENLFRRELASRIGFSGTVEVVDIREHVTWVHAAGDDATSKALDLLRMAVERARRTRRRVSSAPGEWQRKMLVLGGGVAGLTSALHAARRGVEVDLVEKSGELGGQVRHATTLFSGIDPVRLLTDLKEQVQASPSITTHLDTEVSGFAGKAGDFSVSFSGPEGSWRGEYGAVVVAVGADEYRPELYGLGQYETVMTQREFSAALAAGDAEGLGTIVMVQCVGMRDDEHPYCSRFCCAQALHNALGFLDKNPNAQVFVLYRDMMTYGLLEELYEEARRRGVVFVRYRLEDPPVVEFRNGKPMVRTRDIVLGEDLLVPADLLVLSTGAAPSDHEQLARLLGVERDADGFFAEANVKFRPVDFLKDGLYVCGLANSPRSVAETVRQAIAAAGRAVTLLLGEGPVSRPVVAEVVERLCSFCGTCVKACPFEARYMDDEKRVAVVWEHLCQGCGACASACPNGASKLRGYTENQVFSMLSVL
jgi:heterodisulfide reductase subunit A